MAGTQGQSVKDGRLVLPRLVLPRLVLPRLVQISV
jgi:hypothetical protein